MKWQPIIGLEVHIQLATRSKLFSPAATAYGAEPNTQACAIDLGMPGTLPVLNREAVDMAIKFGLAIQGQIAPHSVFSRKNYFYPDLPKGYQISQFDLPIISGGHLMIMTQDGPKQIDIMRAHLEEDAGKSIHDAYADMTAVDLNRAGTALLEIVSQPVLRSAQEAVSYLKGLHSLVRYLDICDGNMQEGSFRCDANVSVKPIDSDKLGTRTEIKNINSFRFVEKAIDHEISRQIASLEQGQTISQETRLYDAKADVTKTMRTKEDAHDYRYFPDPDLLPLVIQAQDIERIRHQLPELPQDKQQRFMSDLGLSHYDAGVLVADKALAYYFEDTLKQTAASAKMVANWVMGELSAALNEHQIDIAQCPISALHLAKLLDNIHDDTINGATAKQVFDVLWRDPQDPNSIIENQGLTQIQDTEALTRIVEQIIHDHPQQVQQYRSGKDKLWGFFVGQAMKATQGKAHVKRLHSILQQQLNQPVP